jgi:hypothetical protein
MYSILLVAFSIGPPSEQVSTVPAIADARLQGIWESKELGAIGYDTEQFDGKLFFIIDGPRFTYRSEDKALSEGIIRVISSDEPGMYELVTAEGPWCRGIYHIGDNGQSLMCWRGPVEGSFSVKDRGRIWISYSKLK